MADDKHGELVKKLRDRAQTIQQENSYVGGTASLLLEAADALSARSAMGPNKVVCPYCNPLLNGNDPNVTGAAPSFVPTETLPTENEVLAAQKVAGLYFEIAEEVVGQDEVRRRFKERFGEELILAEKATRAEAAPTNGPSEAALRWAWNVVSDPKSPGYRRHAAQELIRLSGQTDGTHGE